MVPSFSNNVLTPVAMYRYLTSYSCAHSQGLSKISYGVEFRINFLAGYFIKYGALLLMWLTDAGFVPYPHFRSNNRRALWCGHHWKSWDGHLTRFCWERFHSQTDTLVYSVPTSLAEKDLSAVTLLPVRVGIRPVSAQSSPSCSVGFSALLPDPVLPGIYDWRGCSRTLLRRFPAI